MEKIVRPENMERITTPELAQKFRSVYKELHADRETGC